LAAENQEVIEIYKAWSARALEEFLKGQVTEQHYSQQLQEFLDKIVEEIAVISEERARMNSH
jgi:hypothetical protein